MTFVFVAIALLAIANTLLLFVSKDYARKRQLWPWAALLGGMLFIVAAIGTGLPKAALIVVAPFVGLMVYLSVRSVWFCPACGSTAWYRAPFIAADSCSKCGAKRPEMR